MNKETLREMTKLEHAKRFMEMHDGYVYKFVEESNKIEGIDWPPKQEELDAAHVFLRLDKVDRASVELFVKAIEPNRGKFRGKQGMNVVISAGTVVKHRPPPGGMLVAAQLNDILEAANRERHPWLIHQEYETLHPFMDGNGRSGRILWAWQMVNQQGDSLVLGFLHTWYYQSLEHGR